MSAGIIHRQRQVCGPTIGFGLKPRNSKLTLKEIIMTQISATPPGSNQADDKNAIRPFHANVPDAELTELRRRINATKWPERETVPDA